MNKDTVVTLTRDEFSSLAAKAIAQTTEDLTRVGKEHQLDSTHAAISMMMCGTAVTSTMMKMLFGEEDPAIKEEM